MRKEDTAQSGAFAPPDVIRMTHVESLEKNGFTVCSPISGSMRPVIRPHRDSAVFVPAAEVKKYDVVLYRRREQNIMHRVIGVRNGAFVIRGDNSYGSETVPKEEILGVMQCFYRDETRIEKGNALYQAYARCWVALHPMLLAYKRLRRLYGRIRAALRRRCAPSPERGGSHNNNSEKETMV